MKYMLDLQLEEVRTEKYVIELIIDNEFAQRDYETYEEAEKEVMESLEDYFDMYEFRHCDKDGNLKE